MRMPNTSFVFHHHRRNAILKRHLTSRITCSHTMFPVLWHCASQSLAAVFFYPPATPHNTRTSVCNTVGSSGRSRQRHGGLLCLFPTFGHHVISLLPLSTVLAVPGTPGDCPSLVYKSTCHLFELCGEKPSVLCAADAEQYRLETCFWVIHNRTQVSHHSKAHE